MLWKPIVGLASLAIGLIWFLSGESSDDNRIWIFFKDRPYVQSKSASAVQLVKYSPQAIQRRQTRGRSWTASDLPVEAAYVENVKKAGAKVIVTSRWLNAVSANCNSQCRSNLAKLGFISMIQPVATYIKPQIDKQPGLSKSSIRKLAPDQKGIGLDYGPSKLQLEQLRVPEAHNKGYAGQGETIAIFESGFFKEHVAFKGHEIVAEYDFIRHVSDCGGGNIYHGTVAWSLAGGETPGQLYGPAYKSKVILAITADSTDSESVKEDHMVAAFEWAEQMGATIVNTTYGFPTLYKPSDLNGNTAPSSRIASMAAQKGILVVSSAGFHGPAAGSVPAPSDAFDILTVGATDENGVIIPFSSRGPTADGRIKPELVGRFSGLYKASTASIDAFSSGPSYGRDEASSLVAGAAAAVLSARQDWSPLQVREALMKTASRANRPDNSYGYGVVDVVSAIDFLPTGSVVIDHNPKDVRIDSGQPIQVIARVRAQRGLNLKQVSLFWKKAGSASFQRVSLKPAVVAQNYFEGFIPAQPKATTIQYYLTAKDIKGKSTRAPFGSGKVYQIQVF